MLAIAKEIQVVIAITLLLLLITFFVVIFILVHQRQYHRHVQDKEEMENRYQQEILKAQLEMKERTLHVISQEIHDNIGQILSVAKLNLSTAVLEAHHPAAGKITTSKELVSKAIRDLRNLSKTLNAEHVSRQPLSQSLQFELNLIDKTELYQTHLQVVGTEQSFNPQRQLIVFRIAQEVLHNIIKHAKAKNISITLHYSPEQMSMVIEDDGVGFDPSAINQSIGQERGTGISNIYGRAKVIRANFSIESGPGKGTITRLSLPIYA